MRHKMLTTAYVFVCARDEDVRECKRRRNQLFGKHVSPEDAERKRNAIQDVFFLCRCLNVYVRTNFQFASALLIATRAMHLKLKSSQL